MSKYRATWRQEDLNEFALSHTVRYRDPLNKKRFAIPYKDAAKAQEKMAQLKRDGVKEIEITKDILRGKFKEDVSKDGAYAIGMAKAKDMYNDEKPVDKKTITKAHDIAKAILRKEEVISEELLIEWDKEEQLQEFSKAQLDILARQFADLKGKTISIDRANQLRKIFDKIPNHFLNDLRKRHIPFLSGLALSRMIQKGIPVKEDINERYSVKFSYSKGGKIANAYYDDKEEADKFVKSVIAKGGKAIMTMENVGDYLKSKLNPTQIQNIKKTWQNKKASDVTPAVKAHIKNMDIPTQLAIKQANIPHISKLVEETIVEFTTKQIKQAYGIANDPRYKGGNYDGAVKAIEKLAKGLSKHPDVAKVLKRTNEDASNMAQAKATGTQKRIADLTTSIRDKETRARDINPSDKTKMAIHKADMNHMKLKLADLKDKLRMDRQKRAMAAQNEPETDTSGKPNKKKEITENE